MTGPKQARPGAAPATASAGSAALTAQPLSPRSLRAKYLKAEAARESRIARGEHVSQRDLGIELDLRHDHIARFELEAHPHAPSILHVASAQTPRARVWAETLVRWQGAKLELQVLRASPIVHGDNQNARLLALTLACTQVLRFFAEAMADGELSDAELEQSGYVSREAIAVLLELERYATFELGRRRVLRSERT